MECDANHRILCRMLWEQFIKPGDGFLLVYSVTSHNSFEEISKLCHDIVSVKGEDSPPFVLVGNKCDLEHARQVGIDGENLHSPKPGLCPTQSLTFIEGRDLATHLGCGFFETSTKYRVNIDEVFYTLVREIRKHIRVKVRRTPSSWMKPSIFFFQDKRTPPRVKRSKYISYLGLPMCVVLIWAGFFAIVAIIYGSCCRVNENGTSKRTGKSNVVFVSTGGAES